MPEALLGLNDELKQLRQHMAEDQVGVFDVQHAVAGNDNAQIGLCLGLAAVASGQADRGGAVLFGNEFAFGGAIPVVAPTVSRDVIAHLVSSLDW